MTKRAGTKAEDEYALSVAHFFLQFLNIIVFKKHRSLMKVGD